jgi:hypothetical protein
VLSKALRNVGPKGSAQAVSSAAHHVLPEAGATIWPRLYAAWQRPDYGRTRSELKVRVDLNVILYYN